MRWPHLSRSPRFTLVTLAVAVMGTVVAWAVSAPVYMLIGPAVAVTLAGLAGVRTAVDHRLRDVCFVVLGVAVGAGFDSDALSAMARWPLAFVFMGLVIVLIMVVSKAVLTRWFGFTPHGALLAASPGHLSFVMAMAAETGSDVARISIVQSVRLLFLTLVVPFVALALGVDMSGNVTPGGQVMPLPSIIGVLVLSVAVGLIFQRLRVPAHLLVGAMAVSAIGHLTGLAQGVLPFWMILPAYVVLGALIGTRFSGVTLPLLTSGLTAGMVGTVLALVLAGLGALPVALALGMPLAHVLVAFAPGGLETMIALGAVLAVVPGFVAACHIMRLVILSVVLPWMLARLSRTA